MACLERDERHVIGRHLREHIRNGRVVAPMKHRSDLPSNIVLNRVVLPLVGQDSTGDGLEGAKH